MNDPADRSIEHDAATQAARHAFGDARGAADDVTVLGAVGGVEQALDAPGRGGVACTGDVPEQEQQRRLEQAGAQQRLDRHVEQEAPARGGEIRRRPAGDRLGVPRNGLGRRPWGGDRHARRHLVERRQRAGGVRDTGGVGGIGPSGPAVL